MKIFSVQKTEVQAATAGLAAATIADTGAFISAGQLLKRIQLGSNGLKKDILATTLRIVAGQPCATVLPALTSLRAAMKEAKAAGDSSVGTVRAAVAALAAKHGGDFQVPQWGSAKEARDAQAAAEAPEQPPAGDTPADGGDVQPQATAEEVIARQAAELEELRAIAAEARRLLRMQETATLAEVLAEMRSSEAADSEAADSEAPAGGIPGLEVTELEGETITL